MHRIVLAIPVAFMSMVSLSAAPTGCDIGGGDIVIIPGPSTTTYEYVSLTPLHFHAMSSGDDWQRSATDTHASGDATAVGASIDVPEGAVIDDVKCLMEDDDHDCKIAMSLHRKTLIGASPCSIEVSTYDDAGVHEETFSVNNTCTQPVNNDFEDADYAAYFVRLEAAYPTCFVRLYECSVRYHVPEGSGGGDADAGTGGDVPPVDEDPTDDGGDIPPGVEQLSILPVNVHAMSSGDDWTRNASDATRYSGDAEVVGAPISLPAGSTVHQVRCYLKDEDDREGCDITIQLRRKTLIGSSVCSDVQTTYEAYPWYRLKLTTINDCTHPVNNDFEDADYASYFLQFSTPEITCAARLYECSVDYTPPE